MMEHIRQFDWCSNEPDNQFVTASELDNCVTERILRNKFYDPLLCTSSEDEATSDIDWDTVFFKKKNTEKPERVFVPGLCKPPPYPRKSTLTDQQHFQCLKVLCQENPHILPTYFLARPMKSDYRVFEQVKETYEKEQKEYIEWAKTEWTARQCMRALRPKPTVEQVYDAEFKMRAHEVQSFPKSWYIAAQIPLEMRSGEYQMVLQEELVKVNLEDLPQIQYPEVITHKWSIIKPPSIPEPCTKHPCKFVLPGEKATTILPLTEVHRILAQYATDYGAQYIASENALRCLVDTDRPWTLPISVCETIGADGEKSNVIVLGSEFAVHKELSKTRMYRASRHLLHQEFIPPEERAKIFKKHAESHVKPEPDKIMSFFADSTEVSSDEEDSLIIDPDYTPICKDTCEDSIAEEPITKDTNEIQSNAKRKAEEDTPAREKRRTRSSDINDLGIFNCTCKDTIFETPPPRSFRKWLVKNNQNSETHEIIVHCSHKAKDKDTEVILEPIIEYQLDMGVSLQPHSRLKIMALAMMLRQNATLLNVRLDGNSGDVVTIEQLSPEQRAEFLSVTRDVAHTVYATLEQLRGLLPATYMLHHEGRYGANAMLLGARGACGGGAALQALVDAAGDEAAAIKAPPTLLPGLLPYHKFRRTLPCAFTPYEDQVAKEPKKPVIRQKTPPQAIKWPKKKRKNKKAKRQNAS